MEAAIKCFHPEAEFGTVENYFINEFYNIQGVRHV